MRVIGISIERKVTLWSEGGGRPQEAGEKRGLLLWVMQQVQGILALAESLLSEPPPQQGTTYSIVRGKNWTGWSNRANFFLSKWYDVALASLPHSDATQGKLNEGGLH